MLDAKLTRHTQPPTKQSEVSTFFWLNHFFNEVTEPALYAIRYKYGDMLDGFQALCTASHQERNIILAHYVTKMVKRVEVTRKNDVPFVMGRTKRGYLNSLMRGMKMYEKQHDLILLYGDWTWSKTLFMSKQKPHLKALQRKLNQQFHLPNFPKLLSSCPTNSLHSCTT